MNPAKAYLSRMLPSAEASQRSALRRAVLILSGGPGDPEEFPWVTVTSHIGGVAARMRGERSPGAACGRPRRPRFWRTRGSPCQAPKAQPSQTHILKR
jgi:hypothetical protein